MEHEPPLSIEVHYGDKSVMSNNYFLICLHDDGISTHVHLRVSDKELQKLKLVIMHELIKMELGDMSGQEKS